MKFGFNDTFKGIVRKPGQDRLGFVQLISSGTMAGLFQACITYPLELVRTRLTLGPALGVKYNGILDCFASTVRTEGFRALYKGIGPTIISGAPYVGPQMTFYELYSRNANDKFRGTANPTLLKLACGASVLDFYVQYATMLVPLLP